MNNVKLDGLRMKLGHNKAHFLSASTCLSLLAFLVEISYQIRAEEDAYIVHPKIVRIHKPADLEDSSKPVEDFFIRFDAFGNRFHAKLSRSRGLLATNADSFVIGSNGIILNAENIPGGHFHGKINDQDDSFVSLSHGHLLEGFLQTDNARYSLRPFTHQNASSSTAFPHLFTRKFKRKSSHMTLNGSNAGLLGKGASESAHPTLDYGNQGPVRHKREEDEKTQEKTVETLLVLDQKMTQFYGLDISKMYALNLASIAHEILQDPSIGQNAIKLVVVKILLLVSPQEGLVINHHAHNTLKSFGHWASLQAQQYEASGEKFDYAILLTRYNICKDKEQPCDNSGVSNIGGMCGFLSSVAVIKDEGLQTGFSIAHHVGHSLGMEHDGNGNACDGRNKVMSTSSGYGEGAYVWSSCSAEHLANFLRTPKSKCLNDVPVKEKRLSDSFYSNPGAIFDVTSQCRIHAGENAKGCYYGDPMEICIELQCFVPTLSTCLRTRKPPADGTKCGKTKWCKHGMCVEKHVPDPSYVDGGWSSWGEFGPCTRSCGGGIKFRERSCQNPRPTHGGKYCEGDSRDYQVCNKKLCPEFAPSFRTIQCNKKSGFFLGDIKHSWTYVPGTGNSLESSCNLNCIADNDAEISEDFGRASDGTDCILFNLNLSGRCVAGECISVGCDLVLESRERLDRCGVCKGDGSSCRKIHEKLIEPPVKVVNGSVRTKNNKSTTLETTSNGAVTLNTTGLDTKSPKAAFDLNVQTTPVPKTKTNRTQLSQQKLAQNNTRNGTGMDHLFSALKKLKVLRSLMKAVLNKKCRSDPGCLHKYSYFDLKHKKSEIALPKTFEWVMVSSGCSVTCGIGTETLHPECHRADDGSFVGRKFCSMQPEPPERSRACRLPSCIARWTVSSWESCSKTCGGGLQSRNVFCVKTISDDFIVPDVLCDVSAKPSAKQICNKQACKSVWITEQFGQCSTSCGKGIQTRQVYCKTSKPSRGLVIVDDSQCNASERPERELLCNVHNPCPGDGNCGGNFTMSDDTIMSPNFPKRYENNKECISEVTVPPGMVIALKFTEFAINGSKKSETSCQGDFLRVTFGGCNGLSEKPYSLYCGDKFPQNTLISTTNKICLKFFSDDSGTDRGFSLNYTAIKAPGEASKVLDICDVHSNHLNSSFGALMSPNYPTAYPMNEYCKVTVSSRDKSGFIISFKDFNIGTAGSRKVCDNDYLEIHHNGLAETVCGHQMAKKAVINGNSFTLVFHSGNVKLGGTGFIMTYITRDVMRGQWKKITKIKQDLANYSMQRSSMVLPQRLQSGTPNLAQINPVNNQQHQITTSLTSLKKNDVLPLKPTNSLRMKGSARPSLKAVLDLLASGQKQHALVQKQSPIWSSSNLHRAKPFMYGSYSNAGRKLNINQFAIPVRAINQKATSRSITPALGNVDSRTMANRALWGEYWKLYSQFHKSHRDYIARPLSDQMLGRFSTNGFTQQSLFPQTYSNTRNVVRRVKLHTCPVPAALQCPLASSLQRCRANSQCAYGLSMRCCRTLCPYMPFVCTWTK